MAEILRHAFLLAFYFVPRFEVSPILHSHPPRRAGKGEAFDATASAVKRDVLFEGSLG